MGSRSCGVLIREGKVLLVKHKKLGAEYYVLPGGGVEKGETPEDAVVREFLEETGLRVGVKKLVMKRFSSRDKRDEFYYLVESRDSREPSHLNDPDLGYGVIQSAEWVDLKVLNKLSFFPKEAKKLVLSL